MFLRWRIMSEIMWSRVWIIRWITTLTSTSFWTWSTTFRFDKVTSTKILTQDASTTRNRGKSWTSSQTKGRCMKTTGRSWVSRKRTVCIMTWARLIFFSGRTYMTLVRVQNSSPNHANWIISICASLECPCSTTLQHNQRLSRQCSTWLTWSLKAESSHEQRKHYHFSALTQTMKTRQHFTWASKAKAQRVSK